MSTHPLTIEQVSRPAVVQQLIDQTIKVVEERGEVSLRIRDLVDETGIALATIYKYFGNREGLLDSAYAEMYLRTALHPFSHLSEAVQACTNADEFASVIENFLNLQNTDEAAQRRRTRISVIGSAQARPTLAAKVADMNQQYAEAFAELMRVPQENGWISQDFDVRTIAIWFLGYLNLRSAMDLRVDDWNIDEMNRAYNAAVVQTFIRRA